MTALQQGVVSPSARTKQPAPGDGCPGDINGLGRTFGICIRCMHLGGRQMTPAVVIVDGSPDCRNWKQLPMGLHNKHGRAG